MPVNAGELTERLKVYRAVQTRNDTGETTLSPSLVDTVWGAVRPMTARESMQYGQQVGVTFYKATIRIAAWLTYDMWIDYRGRKLEIAAIGEFERRLYMEVDCVQRHIPGEANGG
jgi:SPP1 family predicted phage head-tail adaptor